MFSFFNVENAKIIYNSDVTFDANQNPVEGLSTEIDILVDRQPRLDNKKVTSSNVDFIYTFAVYSEIFDYPKDKSLKIKFLDSESKTELYDIVRIENFSLLNYCKIYKK